MALTGCPHGICWKNQGRKLNFYLIPMAPPMDVGLPQEYGRFPLEISELSGKTYEVLILAFNDLCPCTV